MTTTFEGGERETVCIYLWKVYKYMEDKCMEDKQMLFKTKSYVV